MPGASLLFARGSVRDAHRQMIEAADGRSIELADGVTWPGSSRTELLDMILLGIAPVTLGAGACWSVSPCGR